MDINDIRRIASEAYDRIMSENDFRSRISESNETYSFLDYLNENAYGSINEYIAKLADLWSKEYGEDVQETLDELMEDSDIRDLVNDAYDNNDAPSDVIDVIFNTYYEEDDGLSDEDYIDPDENLDDENKGLDYDAYIDPEENLNADNENEGLDDDAYIDPEENLDIDMEDHIDASMYDPDEPIDMGESAMTDWEAEYLFEDTLDPLEADYLFEAHEWDGMTPENAQAMARMRSRFADAKSRGKFDAGNNASIDRVTAAYINDFIAALPHVPHTNGKSWIGRAIEYINQKRRAHNLDAIPIPGNADLATTVMPTRTNGANRAPRVTGAQRPAAQPVEAPAARPAEAPVPRPVQAQDAEEAEVEEQPAEQRTERITVAGSKFTLTVEYDPNDTETPAEARQVVDDIADSIEPDNRRVEIIRHDTDEGVDVYELYVSDAYVNDIRNVLRTSWEDVFAMGSVEEDRNIEFTMVVAVRDDEAPAPAQQRPVIHDEPEDDEPEAVEEDEPEAVEEDEPENNEPEFAEEPVAPARQRRETPRNDRVRRVQRSGRWRVHYVIADENNEATEDTDSVVVTAQSAAVARQMVENPESPEDAIVFDCHHVTEVEEA